MPRRTTGSVYRTRNGWGIRWPENGKRRHRAGFRTKTEARGWFADNVAPRLHRGAPSAEISFDAFCDLFLDRHGATVSKRTGQTLAERLAPARDVFGAFTLRELEGSAGDVARWRAGLADSSRYRLSGALRQVLGAAVRWGYLVRIPPSTPAATRSRAKRSCTRSNATRSMRSPSSSAPSTVRWSCSPPRRGCAPMSGRRPSAATWTATGQP
jgi:hypothetical protein